MLNKCNCFDGSYFVSSIFVGSLFFSVVVSEISLGTKLSALDNGFWVSPNREFALGFFNHSDQPYQYSVGIRFSSDSIPVDRQAVVWVAGAEVNVSNQSYFQLTLEGDLVLFDSSNGGVVWSSNTADKSVSCATLQDDGNLVLVNRSKDLVWQSFDTPSDTLLPSQKFSSNEKLRAASRTSVSSYYTLYLSSLGQLELKWESNVIYWVSGSPFNGSVTASVNSKGSFQLLDERSEPVWSVFAEDHSDNVRFRFLRLDADGNLRLYSWDEASVSWKSVWQAVENQCDVFATCGAHGICGFSSGKPLCKCPFMSQAEATSKCLVPFGQSCNSKVSMVTYKHTSLYGIYPPNDSVTTASLDQCQMLCLNDPLCTAVTYSNDGEALCRIKTTQYISGSFDPSLPSISFAKICLDPLAVLPNKTPTSSSVSQSPSLPSFETNRKYKLGMHSLMVITIVTFCMFFVLQMIVGFWLYRKRVVSVRKLASSGYAGSISPGIIRLTYAEIKEMTGNLEHQLGPHSFKAVLQNNKPVAVKKVDTQIEERKFRATISTLGSIHHRHLVKIEGYCCDSGNRFVVYEFLKNGSLEKCLQDPKLCKRLSWKKRMAILFHIAKAISYLHTECREFLSHGNLSCAKVILDENFEAKITEFGLGKLDVEASYGGGGADKDLEDFGRVILILISGRQENEDYLCEWSYNKWISGYGWRVVDRRIEGKINFSELERALRIAYWCLQDDARRRPSMGEVVNVLEGASSVDPPPLPFSFRRPQLEELLTESDLEP